MRLIFGVSLSSSWFVSSLALLVTRSENTSFLTFSSAVDHSAALAGEMGERPSPEIFGWREDILFGVQS